MEKRWVIAPKVSEDLRTQLLANRNLTEESSKKDFLHSHLNLLQDPFELFPDLPKALKRIKKAVREKELIYIYGDFDVDGITAAAILWETIDLLGGKVLPYIPERHSEGYGLHNEALEKLAREGAKVVISVDCGITAVEQALYAKKLKLDLIITDHHQPQDELPECFALLHSTRLAGSGVAFKLAESLLAEYGKEKDQQFFRNLELASLGTVADMVPLVGENRVIVKNGLLSLAGTDRIGLKAIYNEAGISKKVGTYEIGHIIAPRLNAMGRMESALDSLRLLLTRKEERAKELAIKLGQTNRQRQDFTFQAFEHAQQIVKKEYLGSHLFVLSSPEYEQGIVGLVAGRITEKFHRPTAVISEVIPVSKGSARSIQGFNITEAIHSQADILLAHGGHPMAAGFSLNRENIPHFRSRLTKRAEELIQKEALIPELKIDAEIKPNQINKDLINLLRDFEPFGIGNPEPVFLLRNLKIMQAKGVGKEKKHVKFLLKTETGAVLAGIGFGFGDKDLPKNQIDVAFTVTENIWQAKSSIELKLKDIKEALV